jgi:hypothetical protein
MYTGTAHVMHRCWRAHLECYSVHGALALTGGSGSNTYNLHSRHGWTGLLLDGGNENPMVRHSDVCMSTSGDSTQRVP